jgi:hypothetical protein
MAVIVGYSLRTVTEKHTAWRELIDDYPDMPTLEHYIYNHAGNHKFVSYPSFHKKLNETIGYEEQVAALFMKQEVGAKYKNLKSKLAFSTFEEAWAPAIDGRKEQLTVILNRQRKYAPATFFSTATFEEAWTWLVATTRRRPEYGIAIKKFYNGGLSAPGTFDWYDIEAFFDLDGNAFNYRMSVEAKMMFFPDVNYRNLFGGFISSLIYADDGYSFAMLDGTFYVYIPNPRLDRNLMLDENERFFLYKILRVIDKFDPLYLNWMPQPSNYSPYAWRIFQIFTTGGGEDELNVYWEEFIAKLTGHFDDPELKEFKRVRGELTGELLKVKEEY